MPINVFDAESAHVVVLTETPGALLPANRLKTFVVTARQKWDHTNMLSFRFEHAMQVKQCIGYVAGDMFHHVGMNDQVVAVGGLVIQIAQVEPGHVVDEPKTIGIDIRADVILGGGISKALFERSVQAWLRCQMQHPTLASEAQALQVHPQKSSPLERSALRALCGFP